MVLGPRGPFKVIRGPNDWWDVVDTKHSGSEEDYLALAYQGKGAKKMAIESAKYMNEVTEGYCNDET